MHLLETVLPSSQCTDTQEQKQVVDDLLSCLAEAMWHAPGAKAKQQASFKEIQLDLQIQQLKATLPTASPSST